jgi:cation diffusion facilitator CzcD-associated flavoprotein CzcO
MNMDLDSLVTSNSKYMKKEDVPEDGVDLTIKHFTKEVVKGDSGEEQKAAIHFVEDGYKPLLLNQTNIARIKAATGETTVDGVKGKKVKVFCDPFVEFGGRMVGGVRIKKADAAKVEPVLGTKDAPNDDIPF